MNKIITLLAAMSLMANAAGQSIFFDGFEPLPSFTIESPTVTATAGEERMACYYFRSPNAQNWGVQTWQLQKSSGIAHLSLYVMYSNIGQVVEVQPPGTLQSNCDLGTSQGNIPGWVFSTRKSLDSLQLPPDDGTGMPIAFELPVNTPMVLVLHLVNPTANSQDSQAQVTSIARPIGLPFTKAAGFISRNESFNIASGNTVTAVENCTPPNNSKFVWMTVRTRALGVNVVLSDFTATVINPSKYNWLNPPEIYPGPPFHSFGSVIRTECTFTNNGAQAVQAGASEVSDEACEGIGYFFPATKPLLCINGVGPL